MSRRRSLSDPGTVVLAAGAVIGALLAAPVPVLLAAALVLVAWRWGRPALFVVAVAALASGLGHQAIEGARPPPAHPVDGVATLVSDPVGQIGSVRAIIRLDGERYELEASGSAMGELRTRLAGEQIRVSGTARPRPPDMPWLLRRHVVGQIEISSSASLAAAGDGDPASVLANRYRRLLEAGAESLDPSQRALFTGFVVGDDRDASAETRFDFRASGLSHLLAVSGANVAFVLALAGPLLRRLGMRSRFVAAIGVLIFFALLTRFEPSVLRATAMALVATGAATFGWPVSAIRVLALAVTGLVLIDPLLAGSLAFQLSVAASAGIVLLARPIAAHIPGPVVVAEAASVAVAAQIAVAPLLVPTFGGVPVASVPANLLAAPAAGPVMIWGLAAGTVAGLVGGPVAAVLHVPTRLLLSWVETIARAGASLPLGELGLFHVVALGAVIALVVAVELGRVPFGRRRIRRLATAVTLVVLGAAVWSQPTPAPGTSAVGPGAELTVAVSGASVLVVDGRVRTERLLEGLRVGGVRRIDVLVVRTGSRSAAAAAQILLRRLDVGLVLAPTSERLVDAQVPQPGTVVTAPGIDIRIGSVGDALDVSIDAGPGVGSEAHARSSRLRVPGHLGPRGPPLRHHPPGGGDGHPQPHP